MKKGNKLIIVDMAASWKKDMLVFETLLNGPYSSKKWEKPSKLLSLTELEKKNFNFSYNDNCSYGVFQI